MSNRQATAEQRQLWQRWATSRPWRVQGWDDTPGDRGCYVLGGGPENSADEHMVGATLPLPITNRPECEANAELIVTAVNERDELIAEVGRLREALQKLIDFDFECHCEHNNEDCCELNNVFCPRCIAARALRSKESGNV